MRIELYKNGNDNLNNKLLAEINLQSNQQVHFTCPVHPQIRQNDPGNCPICGMTLEPFAPVQGLREMNSTFTIF